MTPGPTSSLDRRRRAHDLAHLHDLAARREPVDLLVVGGGVTGAGVALDAVSRGLSVVLVEKHDLAFGTSRWSSKLVHGGLRYLGTGDVGVAYESAVERDILLTRTAPHLVRPQPHVFPLLDSVDTVAAAMVRTGYLAGDVLRRAAGTPARTLPRSRRLSGVEVQRYAPTVRADGLRGGYAFWDGQLADDARLVVGIARTAAALGARVLTRTAAVEVSGSGAVLRDELTGQTLALDARAVVNATGVWAGTLTEGIAMRPSRGTHLVFRAATFGGLSCALTVPVPGHRTRFLLALPTDDDRVYVGLTDEEVRGDVPDVPTASDAEVDFLLDTMSRALRRPLTRTDVVGSFSGLRPLLDAGDDQTSDLSRKHVVLTSDDGLVSVVGGKLTTYRRMAQDAVDAALATRGWTTSGREVGPCRTSRLPLVGAADRTTLAGLDAPRRLVGRYGTEALTVMAETGGDPAALTPIAPHLPVTPAELAFAVRHEGALDVDDLLERRTRVALVDADRALALPYAEAALALAD